MSTSLQRTYRNLRVGIAGTVVLIGVAVLVAAQDSGLLPSISAYYYTSAHNVLVGALIAAAIAIITLSGRGLQRALLDAAGLFALLIALVPTPISAGQVPGYAVDCPGQESCIPAEVIADVETGVITYLVVAGLSVLASALISLFSREMSFRDSVPSLAIAVAVLLIVLCSWVFARGIFLASAHFIAAGAFFGLIAAVAIANVFDHSQLVEPPEWHKRFYWIIAIAMTVDIILLVIIVSMGADISTTPPPVLVGEAAALVLFVLFWTLQSVEKWIDPDPGFARPV